MEKEFDAIRTEGINIDGMIDGDLESLIENGSDDGISDDQDSQSEEKSETGDGGDFQSDKKGEPSHQGDEVEDGTSTKDNDDDKTTRFDKHPRFQQLRKEREDAFKQAEEYRIKYEKVLEENKQKPETASQTNLKETEETPEFWTTLWGDTDETKKAWKYFDSHMKERYGNVQESVLKKITEEQRQTQDNQQKWVDWVETEVRKTGIQDKNEKNSFLKFMNTYKPTNEKGHLDFRQGFDLYKSINSKKGRDNTEKKNISSSTVDLDKTGGKQNSETIKQRQLRNKSFLTLAREN